VFQGRPRNRHREDALLRDSSARNWQVSRPIPWFNAGPPPGSRGRLLNHRRPRDSRVCWSYLSPLLVGGTLARGDLIEGASLGFHPDVRVP
jgi:hypothetical protein